MTTDNFKPLKKLIDATLISRAIYQEAEQNKALSDAAKRAVKLNPNYGLIRRLERVAFYQGCAVASIVWLFWIVVIIIVLW